MKRIIILFISLFYFSFVVAQEKKMTLFKTIDVTLVKGHEREIKIILSIKKNLSCFKNVVTQRILTKILEDYSKKSSSENNIVHFLPDKITYQTNENIEGAIINFRDLIQSFNLSFSELYLSALSDFSKKYSVKDKGIKTFSINKMYPDYSYPLLENNINVTKIQQISDDYKNSIGINNIGIKIIGRTGRRINASSIGKRLKSIIKQLDLKKVTFQCEKVTVSKPFFINRAFPSEKKNDVQMYAIYTQNKKLSPGVKEDLETLFGEKNVVFHSFSDFSEIQVFQRAEQNNARKLLSKLKTFAQNNVLDFSRFGIVVSGPARAIYDSFHDQRVTYLNEKGEKIDNPFVYRNLSVSGKEIIDNYLTAIAEKKFLEAIKSIKSTYKIAINGDSLDLKIDVINALPYKRIREIKIEDHIISYDAFDGKKGWVSKQGVLIDYTKEQVKEALAEKSIIPQMFYPAEKVKMEGLVVRKSKKYKDKWFYKISIRLADYIVYEYYDRGSGLLLKREFCKKPYTPLKTIYYKDYAKYDGLLVPFNLNIVEGNKIIDLYLTSLSFNSGIDSDTFSKINRTKFFEKDESMINEQDKVKTIEEN